MTSVQACNRYVSSAPEADVGLVEISSNKFQVTNLIGGSAVVDEIYDRKQLGSGTQVVMRGALSSLKTYYVGAYGASYRVLFNDGSYRCFENIFEIVSRSAAPLPAPIVAALTPRVKAGDSGSWICCQTATGNYAYFGNLFAGDGANGYATFADSVIAWAQNTHSMKLTIV
jgi:hypothetical protein